MFDHLPQNTVELVRINLFGDFFVCHKVQLQTLKSRNFGSFNDRRRPPELLPGNRRLLYFCCIAAIYYFTVNCLILCCNRMTTVNVVLQLSPV
jgi:hypothetical protein